MTLSALADSLVLLRCIEKQAAGTQGEAAVLYKQLVGSLLSCEVVALRLIGWDFRFSHVYTRGVLK